RFFLVVLTLDQGGAALVADAGPPRRFRGGMIRRLALRAAPAAADAADDLLVRDGQQDDGIDVEELLPQHGLERGGLGQRTGVAVHDELLGAVVAAETLVNHV